MKRGRFLAIAAVMVVAGAAVRVNNAMEFPGLRGYDGFSHFVYIWYLAETGRVPLATAGWEFFHPPLYYAWMAMVWNLLSGTDPFVRLKVGTLVLALLSLVHAGVSYVVVRRYFPGKRLIHLLAVGLMLFLPVHLYSVGFLGNEGLNGIMSSISLLLLLWVLKEETWKRAALLGLSLGLAMLVKFTALAVVAGAFGTIGLRALLRREPWAGARTLAVVGAVMLVVCGWFYGRNILLYGNPFQMSRDEFMLRHVENFQTKGHRGFLEYVLFDPVVFLRPHWPRGLPITGLRPARVSYSALRESVWTGIYANAWFDGFGGWVLPPVTKSEGARRAGQLLLTLALVPTVLVLLGIATALARLWRRGWNDTLVAMVVTFTAMMVIFIHGTRVVPMHAAIKATYLIPVSVVFSFWFALGSERLLAWRPRWLRPLVAVCLVLAVISATVFCQGRLFTRDWLADGFGKAAWQNLYGVVYYAGGQREKARERFKAAAADNWHLGWENLASLAYEEGRPLEALYDLRNASRLEPRQLFGTVQDRRRYDASTQAEYLNSMAVMYYRLGWLDAAIDAAERALAHDGSIPEVSYNLAVLKLVEAQGLSTQEGQWRQALIGQARRSLARSVFLDPGFFEARALLGVAQAMEGDCDGAEATISKALAPHPGVYRKYPLETGPGDMHGAGVGRRRRIEQLPLMLQPRHRLSMCAPYGV